MRVAEKTLADLLREIADSIEAGDSYEGSISWTCLDSNIDPGIYTVEGAYRVGNSMGQGGTVLLSDVPEQEDEL